MSSAWCKASLLVLLASGFAAAEEELPLKDPMRPYQRQPSGDSAVSGPTFDLTAVLISESRRIAVVNGGLYREGDEIAGSRLTQIRPESIRLRRGGTELVVHLNGRRSGTSVTGEISK